MKHICLVLAITFLTQHLPAQPPRDLQNLDRHAVDAPLALFTTGEGEVLPFEYGQMLEVGRTYFMLAIPDRGYVFKNWTPIQVSTFTLFVLDEWGNRIVVSNSVTLIPMQEPIREPILRFTMQTTEVIFTNELAVITSTTGWQANFAPAIKHFRK